MFNKEIRRDTDVVDIFPNRAAIIRLVGAVLAEQTDEWTEQRRYMGVEVLAKATIEAGETLVDVERAITQFVDVINGLPNIHTIEREDAAEAVFQLAGKSPLEVPDEVAQTWFDAARDF
jgi:hypothetical protein